MKRTRREHWPDVYPIRRGDTAGNGPHDALLAVMRAKARTRRDGYVMPGYGWFEPAQEIAAHPEPRDIPVLLISGAEPTKSALADSRRARKAFCKAVHGARTTSLLRSMVRSAQLLTEAANFRQHR